MKDRTTRPYLILMLVTAVLISLDMEFEQKKPSFSVDLISEILIFIQPLIWIFFEKNEFKNKFLYHLRITGIIVFFAGYFQDFMDEFYELEGILGELDSIFVPIGLVTISASVVLGFAEEKRRNRVLFNQSRRDSLTGLYNKRYLQEKLKEMLDDAEAESATMSLAFIDVDNFKSINDTYGHEKGDEILESIGEIISRFIRSSDYAFRYGGDEFVIIFSGIKSTKAVEVIERIRKYLIDSLGEVKLTISSGVADYKKDERYDEWVSRADGAMYFSKKNGKNKTTLFPMPS